MITTDTVFVLGAGASKPFGFPTGAELRTRICRELGRGHAVFDRLAECGHSEAEVERFRASFEQSAVASIDMFIAFRSEFRVIGEHTIAALLLPAENMENLTRSHWCQLLWNEMLAGATTPEELLQNKIKFITFNYDRSLEQYLFGAIQNVFGLSTDETFSYLSRVSIRHVYGSLGEYDPVHGYRYGGHENADFTPLILAAQRAIKTVPSIRGPADDTCAEWLAKAEMVFVLGFGFDPTNCARIALHEACSSAPRTHNPRQIFASAFNLTHAETRWCEANSCTRGHGGIHWTNGDALALLRDRRNLLN